MENAAVLYGNFDGKGNSLVIRTNNLSNLLYRVDGYLIGFTSNNIDFYHFEQSDFKGNETKVSAGYFSLEDWLKYWADQLTLDEIRKFDKSNFNKVEVNDVVNIVKQKISPDTQTYNYNEEYKYTWTYVDKYYVKFNDDIFIPPNTNPQLKVYPPENYATTFYNTNKGLLNNVSSKNKNELAKILIYSAYCIHHTNVSVLSLFTETTYQQYIVKQQEYWSNPFGDTTNLSEIELMNLVKSFYQEVLNFYGTGFRCIEKIKSSAGNKKLFYLTLFMSVKSLTTLTSELKIETLKECVGEMSKISERESVENLAVRVASSFDANSLNRINKFLEELVSPNNCIENNTLYQYLYDRMSTSWNVKKGLIELSNWIINTDFKPTDTKGAFVQAIYILWQFSKYNPFTDTGGLKPNMIGFKKLDDSLIPRISYDVIGDNNVAKAFYYSHEAASKQFSNTVGTSYNFYYTLEYPDAAPIVIPYSTQKTVGLYLNRFNFEFDKFKIKASEQYIANYSTRGGTTRSEEALYGTYDIFQPITLLNTDIDSPVPIVATTGDRTQIGDLTINSFIPIFLLKYYDDAIDKGNVETLIGYVVDGALTFSGVGNLTKLRHLRWAALGTSEAGLFLKQNLRVILGGLEFSSGVVGYFANFIECNTDDEFCKNFKNFVMAFQLATLSLTAADGLATLAMKKSAGRMVKATGKTSQADIVDELKVKLGAMNGNNSSQAIIDDLAEKIYYMDNAAGAAEILRGYAKNIVTKVKDKIIFAESVLPNSFQNLFYTFDDILEIAEHVSLKSIYGSHILENFCTDLVFIASKKGKFISKAELKKQISFWFDEIYKRKFPSGFTGIPKFKLFGQKAVNYFSDEFVFWNEDILEDVLSLHDDFDFENWLDFDFSKKVNLKVQGSANRKYLPNDPLLHVSSSDLPIGAPGDFEFALEMGAKDFDDFINICKEYGKTAKYNTSKLAMIQKKGFFNKDDIAELFGKSFIDGLRNAVKNETAFDFKKINFGIVKKGGKYDLEPYLDFPK